MKINPDVVKSSVSQEHNNEEGTTLLLKEFEQLKSQWYGVLQDSAYERILGHLTEAVLRVSMKPVLDAGNIHTYIHIHTLLPYIYAICHRKCLPNQFKQFLRMYF